jgi:MFS family permease
MAAHTDESFSWRLQGAIYGAAFFNGNLVQMVSVAMPLWAQSLGASPLVIGAIIASRQILTVTMSIHGGALLDRFEGRQVIFALGLIGCVTMGLFPLLPFVGAAIGLQMISGFGETTNWIGAQALVGRMLKGHPLYAGRMTAAARIGGFIGPYATGIMWQHVGPFGAFWFLALWVLAGGAVALLIPKGRTASAAPADRNAAKRKPDVMPKLSDYVTAFKLLIVPAIALVILTTFMRQTGSGIQNSFYTIWLHNERFTASEIGLLLGIGNVASALAALGTGTLARRIAAHWLLIIVVLFAIVPITITPLLGTFALLAIAIALRGVGQGLILPLMMTLTSRAVSPELQGRVTALRITFNRGGNALVPLAMGAIAEAGSLDWAFYWMGIAGCTLVGGLALWVWRSSSFRPAPAPAPGVAE